MLEGGFILLHRSILRWEWYGDLNTARLFIHLLLTVNYEPQRWQGIAVERGSAWRAWQSWRTRRG